MAAFSRVTRHVTKLKIISNWFQAGEYDIKFSVVKWPPQAADLNLPEHLWDVVKREIQIIDAIMSIWIQIYAEIFPETY